MKQTVILAVLDGWGIGPRHPSNAIYDAKPQTINYIAHHFPSLSLQSSGISVGLPWGEEGNSEVGHLTMGVGRVIYQHYPRISLSIRDKSFFKNSAITNLFKHVKQYKSKINFVGLVGDANVHSSMEHLNALIAWAQKENIPFALHLFTDGRDSAPRSAYHLLSSLPQEKIGSISGRYYAMDRDKQWTLTNSAYQALVGAAPVIAPSDIKVHLQKTYDKNLNDEYIIPSSIDPKHNAIHDNDAVFFFNFREDRMRQLSEAFIQEQFSAFPIKHFSNLSISSMTLIEKDFSVPVAFPPQLIRNPLGKVLAENNKTQLRVAETQKYAHVTFFFNGLRDKPFKNEYRILIPSNTITRQDQDPGMRAESITTRTIGAINNRGFDFILMNYANSDMLAHTGNLDATIKAIQIVDGQLARLLKTVFSNNAILLITSDHGNAERLYNPETGEVETKHDANPVPFYIIGKDFFSAFSDKDIAMRRENSMGMLSDIAPTILDLMKIPKPSEMTGQSLLNLLRP